MLPREHSRISIAYTTNKLRDLLPRFSSCSPLANRALSASDVVYKYSCPCGQVYIGETKRRLAVRISEHAKPKTPLMEHVNSFPGAKFMDKKVVATQLDTPDLQYIHIRYLTMSYDESTLQYQANLLLMLIATIH